MKKKIAIITSGYFPVPPVKGGAVETLVNFLVEENNIKGQVELTIFSMFDSNAEKISKSFLNTIFRYVRIPNFIKVLDYMIYLIFRYLLRKKKHMSFRYIAQRLYFIELVSSMVSKVDYDAIVFQNHPTLLNILRKHDNFKRYNGKFYYHAHNEISNSFGNFDLLRECKKIICVSEYIKNNISHFIGIFNNDRYYVLKNRIDEQRFRNLDIKKIHEFRRKFLISEDDILFTFTGRLNPEKGVKELLLAFKKANLPNSKLIIAGGYFFSSNMKSNYERELKKIASEMEDDVIFTGYLDYDSIPTLYGASDVVVIPSIWNDPAPLTVIECITSGKPLITTFSGGIPEYASSKFSILYPIDNCLIDNLSDGIKLLASNKKLRDDFSLNAIQESKNWTKEGYYLDFLKCFE